MAGNGILILAPWSHVAAHLFVDIEARGPGFGHLLDGQIELVQLQVHVLPHCYDALRGPIRGYEVPDESDEADCPVSYSVWCVFWAQHP